MQVNLDIVGNESSCSQLRPFLRVIPVVMSNDYSTHFSVLDMFENIRAQALFDGWIKPQHLDLDALTRLGCLNHNQVIHARPSGLHLSPQTFENRKSLYY